ncbi:hypothetical protein RBH20_19210 [Haloarcula sp. H-GB4]|nr:hypothetical protein [Haloarcula sp. H-GB4]MDQ2074661.1 hypothetical protein [Haloarcula sp. H-GB4]
MNDSEATSVTRRRILRTSVGAVGTLGVAGCQSGAEEAASATGDTPAENDGTATVTDGQGTTTGDAATASSSYSVSMEPVGEVTFESGVEQLRDDPVGSQLTAVDEDRLYRGGTEYQGPIINLFQTEAAAKQLYPDQFGAWNGLGEPLPEAERLFDYQRVADAINGRV